MRNNDGFPTYPKTPHLLVDGGKPLAFSDTDGAMPEDDTRRMLNEPVLTVYEKLDGANAAMILYYGHIQIRNRTHTLNKGYAKAAKTTASRQFIPFWNYAHDKRDALEELNSYFYEPVAVYGEWLLVRHGITYTRLPDKFVAFAMFLCESRRWLRIGGDTKGYDHAEILNEAGFVTPQVLAQGKLTLMELSEMVSLPSVYGDELREGIIISDNARVCKMVRPDYIPNSQFDNAEIVYQPQWEK